MIYSIGGFWILTIKLKNAKKSAEILKDNQERD